MNMVVLSETDLRRLISEEVTRALSNQQSETAEEWLTVRQVCDMLKISRKTLHYNRSELTPTHEGRAVRYRLSDVKAYMNK